LPSLRVPVFQQRLDTGHLFKSEPGIDIDADAVRILFTDHGPAKARADRSWLFQETERGLHRPGRRHDLPQENAFFGKSAS